MKQTIEDMTREEMEAAIDNYIIGPHAERNRQILKRRLIDGICYEPLAEEFKLSVRYTKTIVYKNIKVLLRHLSV